jgi:hypothetical protein
MWGCVVFERASLGRKKGRICVLYTCYEVIVVLISSLAFMSLAAPSLVNAATLQLSWSDNSQDEDGFHIERKQGTGGTFSLIATTGANATSYSDANLASSTTYCYRVNAFNSAGSSGYTNESCATTSGSNSTPPPTTPTPVGSSLTAALLGQTGEDIAGMVSETPDGIQDVHIRLSGVQGTISGARITGANGIWETPFNGQNWIVAIRPQSNPSVVDLFFDFFQAGASYTVALTFADGSTQTVQAASSSTPPVSSLVAAALLGQTGEDVVGTVSETPDGIPDVHITLSGVQGTISGARIVGANGIWETPFNGQNWIVAIRPQSNGSIVDLFFDFFQAGASYTVALTFADGSTQIVQANAATGNAVQLSKNPVTLLGNSNGSTSVQAAIALNTLAHIGLFRPDTGAWLLDVNGNGQGDGCTVDICIPSFGQTGDLPVAKTINNLQTLIGIFRQGTWIFDTNGNDIFDNCSVDECDNFGIAGDLPVTGDWNGSGNQMIGVFRPSTGQWFLELNGTGVFEGCNVDKCLGPFGVNGDLPVAGDWTGTGRTGIGVFRPSTGEWFLELNGSGVFEGCNVDKCFGPFGADGDLPIAGDWSGTGQVRIGIYRPSTGDWLLDMNGNGTFDGCTIDACLGPLGQPGGLPVTGQW